MFPIIRILCQWQKSILFIWKCLHSHSDVILHVSHWDGWQVGQPGGLAWPLQRVRGFWGTTGNEEILHDTSEIWNSVSWKGHLSHLDRFSPHSSKSSNESKKKKKSWNPILKSERGILWWLSGREACQFRRHGFDPWSRKIPRASGQLSGCATTTEPASWDYWNPHMLDSLLCKKRSMATRHPRTPNQRVAPALHKERRKPTNQQRPDMDKNK